MKQRIMRYRRCQWNHNLDRQIESAENILHETVIMKIESAENILHETVIMKTAYLCKTLKNDFIG